MVMHLDPVTGAYDPVAPKVMAHEIGHLMGSFHDGQFINSFAKMNPYMFKSEFSVLSCASFSVIAQHVHFCISYCLPGVPCNNTGLMTSGMNLKSEDLVGWTECTRKQIDAEDRRRMLANEDCTLT